EGFFVDLDERSDAVDKDIFVGLMRDGLVAGELGAEADAVFQGAGVSAAADGNGLRLLPRALFENFRKRFTERTVLFVIERRLMVERLVTHAHLVDGGDDILV